MRFVDLKANAGHAILFVLAFVSSKGAAFLGPLLLSQIMSLEDYGSAELSLSIGVIGAQMLNLGVAGAIPQLVIVRKDDHVIDLVYFIVASIGMVGLLGAATALATSGASVHVFAAVAVAGGGGQIAFSAYFRAMGRRYGILLADNLSLYLFLIVGLAVFLFSGHVALWPMIAGYGAISACLCVFAFFSLVGTIRPNFFSAYSEALGMGFFMTINSLVYFAIANSSRIVIGYFLSVEAVSIYSICSRIAISIFFIHQLIGTAFFRQLYGASAEWFDRYYVKLLAMTLVFASGLLFVFEFYGQILLPGWTNYEREISQLLPIVCMQVIWWVSLAVLELRVNRALISRKATPWLLTCAGCMIGVMYVVDALGYLSLPVATLVVALGLFAALQAQLLLLWRQGVRLPRMYLGVLVPLVFLVPAFLLAG